MHGARKHETLVGLGLPLGAVLVALLLFGLFVAGSGSNPLAAYALMYVGGFGTWFSWQNTLQRAAPLILTALCTAIPAQLGLVIIGGEGALVLGGLSAVVMALLLSGVTPWVVQLAMGAAGMCAGGLLILVAGALRYYRGVNETISSLLLAYIAIAGFHHLVEGPLRDPASLNKPSTAAIGDMNMVGMLPGMDVHWGLVYGLLACVVVYVLMSRTAFGFAARMVGGNPRAAQLSGLPIGRLLLSGCFLAGAAAGLAGMVEVAAVHGRANASLIAGYGYTGILVAFLARHQPLAIIPVAVLLGGIGGSFLSLYYPGSWNEGLSSGQGLMAVALVIFARWEPMACFWAALLFGGSGALGPALQSVGVTYGYYLFNAAPYVLTLLLMIVTSSAQQRLAGAPGELSVTK